MKITTFNGLLLSSSEEVARPLNEGLSIKVTVSCHGRFVLKLEVRNYLTLCVALQMNASNLAVCFLPSFFRAHPSASYVGDLKMANHADGGTSPGWDHKVAVTCITFLINNSSFIFQVIYSFGNYCNYCDHYFYP